MIPALALAAALLAAPVHAEPAQQDTAQHDTAQHDTAQHDTAQRDTAQHVSAPPDTAQKDSAQKDTAPAETLAARLARWQEAVELDQPGEVLADPAWQGRDREADARAVALYARALHQAGETEAALRLCGDAGAADAPAPLVLAAARIAIDLDELARALALLAPRAGAAGPVRFPDEPDAWLLLGRARARAGDLAGAEPLLTEFVRRAPWHVEAPNALFVLVDCARARGDAAEAARRATAQRQSAEWHSFYRARRIQARESPRDPLPRLGLAQLWLAAGELPRARAELDAALALDARFCRAIELLAEVERRAGAVDAALARCKAALDCDPTLAEARLVRARIALAAGRGDDALADLVAIADGPRAEEPRVLEAHLLLARTLQAHGDDAQAARRYARYQALGGREAL